MTPPALVLVLPAYNEAARLDGEALLEFLGRDPSASLLVVDDGSTDGTAQVVEGLAARAPGRLTLVRLAENVGKAEAVRQGVLKGLDAGAGCVGFADADLAAPLDEVAALRRELERFGDAWAAFGSRVKLLGRRIERWEVRHYFGRVFATAASLALDLPVYDTQCGLKLFRNVPEVRQAFAEPFRSRWIFDVELLARLAMVAGDDTALRVREVPLEVWVDRGGSRLRLKDFLRAPIELLRIRSRYRRDRDGAGGR